MRALAPLLLVSLLAPFGGAAYRKAEEGNRLYLEGRYEDALRAYTEAQVAAPEAPELHYDIGNVLYRQEDYEGSAEAFTRALLSAPPSIAPSAAYNLGNALYELQRYDEAVRAYRRTLEADPQDGDAKRNMELALRALHQQQQQQQDQQQQEQQEQQQEQQQDQQQDQQQQEQQDQQQQQNQQQDAAPQEAPERMSPEEAERLLSALEEEEAENLKRQAVRKAREEASDVERDW